MTRRHHHSLYHLFHLLLRRVRNDEKRAKDGTSANEKCKLEQVHRSLKYLVVFVAGLMFHGLLVSEDCLLVFFSLLC